MNQPVPTFNQEDLIKNLKKAALTYEQSAVVEQEVAQRLCERLDYMKIQPKIILELGAGTGICTRLLEKRYPRAKLFAVDLSLDMLRQAQKHKKWLSRTRLINADAHALPLPRKSVDMVVSNLMLPWCPNISQIFMEVRQVLKPEGLLLFSSFGPDTYKELRQSWQVVDDYPYVHPFIDMHDIGDALLHSQFLDPVMDMEILTMKYQDIYRFFHDQQHKGSTNILKERRKTLTGKQRFRQFLAAYEELRDQEGLWPVTYEIIYGHAWAPKQVLAKADEMGVASIKATDIIRKYTRFT